VKTGGFGKTSEFDGHLSGTFDFVNGVGQGVIPDEGLVGGVVKDDGLVGGAKSTHALSWSLVMVAPVGLLGKQR
jgi:hypothetical protein